MTEVFPEGNVEKCGWRSPSDETRLPAISATLRPNSNFPEADVLDSDERFDGRWATTQPPIEPERSICFPWNCGQRIRQRLASDDRRYTPPTRQTRTLPGRVNL